MTNNTQSTEVEAENQRLHAHVQVLRTFIQNMGKLGFYERNIQTGEVTANSFWLSCGYQPEELKADTWLSLVHPEDLPRLLAIFGSGSLKMTPGDESQELAYNEFFEVEYRVRTAWGQWRWVLNRGIIVGRDDEGKPSQYLGIDIDITDRKQAEDELRLQQEASEQRALEAETLRMVGAVIASNLETQETLQRILEQAAIVVPFEHASIYKLEGTHLELIGSSSGRNSMSAAARKASRDVRVPKKGSSPHSQVVREEQPLIFNRVHELFPHRTIDGRTIKSWMGVPLMLRGSLTGMLSFESSLMGFFTEIHLRTASAFADSVTIALENARLYEELRRLAITDELTAMYTRRWMLEYARRQLDQSHRAGGQLSLLMIDVDFFKRVNDEYGHLQGDIVLKQISQICVVALRAGDVICRYGGEEFLALLPDTGVHDAILVAERLRQSVESATLEGLKNSMTISLGISSLGTRYGVSLEDLIHECDTALYSAKRQGRNCWVRFE